MTLNELKNPVFQAGLRNTKTAKELVELARESDIDLSDDQLAAGVSGGQEWYECDRDDCFEI